MPGYDFEAAREEFLRLERTGGRFRLDRVPTREDIHAHWHYRMERLLLRKGIDPTTENVGRHSIMISGKGRPDIAEEPPLEQRFRYDPMPLPWFENPIAHKLFRDPDPEHALLELLCAGHLAGFADRPSGTDMFRLLVEGTRNEGDRQLVRELLCDIRPEMYPQLRREDALSAWHLARAALDCEVKRGTLSRWLNQFAIKPGTAEIPAFS